MAVALGGGAALLVLAVPATPALSRVLLIDEPPVVAGTSNDPGQPVAVRLPPNAKGEMPPDPNEAAFQAHKARQDARYALTSEELERAKGIVTDDAYLKSLFNGVPFTAANFGSWKSVDGDDAHGAVMDLTLARPVSPGMTELPVLEELPGKAYKEGKFQASIRNAAAFRVIVDFSSGAVVDVMPINDGAADVRPGPRNPARDKSEGR